VIMSNTELFVSKKKSRLEIEQFNFIKLSFIQSHARKLLWVRSNKIGPKNNGEMQLVPLFQSPLYWGIQSSLRMRRLLSPLSS